jgi:hypothetical protein
VPDRLRELGATLTELGDRAAQRPAAC